MVNRDNNTQSVVRVRELSDVLGLVPHLLGFHPEESLVLLVLAEGKVALTARIDLAPMEQQDGPRALIEGIQQRFPGSDLVCVSYSARADRGLRVLNTCLELVGPERVSGAFHVDAAGWWSEAPFGPRHRYDPKSSALAAQATLLGMPARRNRAELAASIEGPPQVQRRGLRKVLGRVQKELDSTQPERRLDLFFDLVDRLMTQLAEGQELSDDDCARLAVLVTDVDVRTAAWLAMNRDNAEESLELWIRVVQRTVPEFQLTVLCLVGLAAWIAGDGALHVIALERAERICATFPLVVILRDVNENMIPPSHWDELRAQAQPMSGDRAAS